MIQIPTNEQFSSDYKTLVKEVLSQLTTGCDKYGEGQVGTPILTGASSMTLTRIVLQRTLPTRSQMTSRQKASMCISKEWDSATRGFQNEHQLVTESMRNHVNTIIGMNYEHKRLFQYAKHQLLLHEFHAASNKTKDRVYKWHLYPRHNDG